MSPTLALGLITGVFVLDRLVFHYRRKTGNAKPRRFLTAGGLLGFAAFCAFGFLSAGELSGSSELWWKTVYGVFGVLAVADCCVNLNRSRQ